MKDEEKTYQAMTAHELQTEVARLMEKEEKQKL